MSDTKLCEDCGEYPALIPHEEDNWPALCHSCQSKANHEPDAMEPGAPHRRSREDEIQRGRFWELANLKVGQTPEVGVLIVVYIDTDGERRFNWQIADNVGGMEVSAMMEILNALARSLTESAEAIPFDADSDENL